MLTGLGHIDKETSNGQCLPKTDSSMLAIKEQVVNTIKYRKYAEKATDKPFSI